MGLKNYALNSGKDETYAVNYADNNIDKYAAKPWSGYTDWEDVLFRNGSHQNYEVNAQSALTLSFNFPEAPFFVVITITPFAAREP